MMFVHAGGETTGLYTVVCEQKSTGTSVARNRLELLVIANPCCSENAFQIFIRSMASIQQLRRPVTVHSKLYSYSSTRRLDESEALIARPCACLTRMFHHFQMDCDSFFITHGGQISARMAMVTRDYGQMTMTCSFQ